MITMMMIVLGGAMLLLVNTFAWIHERKRRIESVGYLDERVKALHKRLDKVEYPDGTECVCGKGGDIGGGCEE